MVFAIRAGVSDARSGTSPRLFWQAVVYRRGRARDLLGLAWKDVNKVFLFACVLVRCSPIWYGPDVPPP